MSQPNRDLILHALGLAPYGKVQRWSTRNLAPFSLGTLSRYRCEQLVELQLMCRVTGGYAVTGRGAPLAGVDKRIRKEHQAVAPR